MPGFIPRNSDLNEVFPAVILWGLLLGLLEWILLLWWLL